MNTLSEQKVTIVGLGLMGGSLAMALRAHVAELIAVDRDEQTLARARAQRLVDGVSYDVAAGVEHADLVILATPVRTIRQQLSQLPDGRPGGCTVIDLGSTKAEICRAMAALPASFAALGGHPMCGKEIAGFSAAERNLYVGQTFILCRTARTTPQAEKLALELVEVIGGRPLFLPPETHDALVAVTSHLPFVLSAILINLAGEHASLDENTWRVSASGLRDMTRLAGSNPAMMLDILLTNRNAIAQQLRTFQERAAGVRYWLETADEEELQAWVLAAQAAYRIHREQRQD